MATNYCRSGLTGATSKISDGPQKVPAGHFITERTTTDKLNELILFSVGPLGLFKEPLLDSYPPLKPRLYFEKLQQRDITCLDRETIIWQYHTTVDTIGVCVSWMYELIGNGSPQAKTSPIHRSLKNQALLDHY